MKKIVALVMALLSQAAFAETDIQKAQEKLKATFSNISVVGFQPSPVPGLFEVNMGTGIIYFHPEKQLLMFGEIFDASGNSLTAESLKKMTEDKFSEFDTSKALVIGDPKGVKIIEFSDPDCPFCRRYDQFLQTQNVPVQRFIFFDTRVHPKAVKKVEHILCSKDRESAYKDMYAGKIPGTFKSCDAGKEAIKEHLRISKSVGVSGTPSLLLEGRLITGFQSGVIVDYLKKQQQKIAAQ
ncbi:DsbC family protein [Endozoicomonas sp. ONNA1]|uniref:DsbC family protein n=1 Tax=Endozoicomonas sp. ONNA1 TaxID=2828740 RepID=UPI002147F7D6|nr:DsbC family protein [Endozoicomonas sp. ONNA1]